MRPELIVVTGATGFTGPFVVRELAGRFPDARLRCLVRPSSDRARLSTWPLEFVEGDLRDEASLGRAFAGADTLVNVASLGFDWVDPLFRAIKRSTLRRGIFIGTTAMLTNLPVASKPARERAEQLVRDSGLAWTILRPTMIYGTPADRNIVRLIRFVSRSPIVPVIAPDALQQPVHVEDVAAAVGAALATDATIGRAYNLAGRDALPFMRLVRETAAAVGKRRVVVTLPFAPILWAAKLYARLTPHPRIKVEQVLRLREDKSFDYADAARDFGFNPRSFEAGVAREAREAESGRQR